MLRALGLIDAIGYCLLAFVVYKTVQLGPYEAAMLFGRCVHVFTVAARGYL